MGERKKELGKERWGERERGRNKEETGRETERKRAKEREGSERE